MRKIHKWIAFIAINVLYWQFSNAQVQQPDWVNQLKDKKDSWIASEAEKYYSSGNLREALKYYFVLHERKPKDEFIQYRLGICYLYKSDEPDKAWELLSPLENPKNKKLENLSFYLGRAQHIKGNYQEANKYYSQFLSLQKDTTTDLYLRGKYFLQQTISAQNVIKRDIELKKNDVIQVLLQSQNINTEYDEYMPVTDADETKIIFTYRGPKSKGGMLNENGDPDPNGAFFGEDIYEALRTPEGDWGIAHPIDNLNTDRNDAPVALSADGQTLFLYRNRPDSSGNIYYSKLVGNQWSPPAALPGGINTEYWEGSACLAFNENVIIFSSERPGGFGGRDLWRSVKLPNGKWSLPINLGPNVNTPYDEDSPFLFYDGVTLYFSSNGPHSMGGYDVFYSTLQQDSTWSVPVNLGTKVNTPFDDKFYVINASGSHGYYSSMRKSGIGGQDIYLVAPGHFNNTSAFVLKGIVYLNEVPGYSDITVKFSDQNSVPSNFNSNASTGKYLLVFPLSFKYDVSFEANGFVPYRMKLNLKNVFSFRDSVLDIHLYNKEDFDKYMRIAGTVYDPKTGKPLAGVKVELRSKDGEVIMTTTTDENGNYVFNKVPKGKEYEINVDYPGEVFVEGKATDLYGQNGLAGVSINDQITGDDGSFKFNAYGTGAEDAYMNIAGKVIHPKTKKPIPGVRVQLRSKDGSIVRNTITNYEGDFVFKKVPKNKDYDIFVDYPTASVVNGIVTDHTGKGIEGKKIGDQITDKDGKFSLLTSNKGMLVGSPYPPGTLEKYLMPFTKDNLNNALKMDEAMLAEFLNKFGDYSAKDLVFKVQIGAYLYANNFKYFKYETLDKVDKKLYDDNLTRFVLSTAYKTFRQAWTRQWEARKYPDHDAFVVIFYKGQRMLISKDLIELLKADNK